MDRSSNNIEREYVAAYDAHGSALYRHAFYRLSDKARAEELVEETFMRTWEYIVEGKEITNMRALLYRILGNLIIDEYRRRKVLSLDELSEEGFDPSALETLSFEDKITADHIIRSFGALDEPYRQIVILRFVDDMAIKDIAELLGESENAISVRLNRALKQLREILGI